MSADDVRLIEDSCPCGSGVAYGECCGMYVTGAVRPDTALQLMRSRYTAYCLRDGPYLLKTWHPSKRPATMDFSADDTVWLSLEITRHEAGGGGDDEGKVGFLATYRQGGILCRLRERSRFVKESGEWFYLDGVVQSEPKPGRNDPCGCGSGKKYKKCCGLPINTPTTGADHE
jgi:SEC-C motif-containing protein